VHLIRSSLEHASYKVRKAVATALRQIYDTASEQAAQQALQAFAQGLADVGDYHCPTQR
jgi:transposase-like protein